MKQNNSRCILYTGKYLLVSKDRGISMLDSFHCTAVAQKTKQQTESPHSVSARTCKMQRGLQLGNPCCILQVHALTEFLPQGTFAQVKT